MRVQTGNQWRHNNNFSCSCCCSLATTIIDCPVLTTSDIYSYIYNIVIVIVVAVVVAVVVVAVVVVVVVGQIKMGACSASVSGRGHLVASLITLCVCLLLQIK